MLIYMFVYIYQAKFLIEKYSFMDEKEKEPCRSWSQPRCVQWAKHTVHRTQLRPQYPSPCLTSAKLGGPEGSAALSGSPATKAWEREETEVKRTGIAHPFLLWSHGLSCSLMNYITFPKEGKRSLSQCLAFSCLWLHDAQDRKTHSPKEEHGKETWQYPSPSPRNEAPSRPPSLPPFLPPSPRSSDLALSLPSHLSSVSKPLRSPGPSCSFTVWFL